MPSACMHTMRLRQPHGRFDGGSKHQASQLISSPRGTRPNRRQARSGDGAYNCRHHCFCGLGLTRPGVAAGPSRPWQLRKRRGNVGSARTPAAGGMPSSPQGLHEGLPAPELKTSPAAPSVSPEPNASPTRPPPGDLLPGDDVLLHAETRVGPPSQCQSPPPTKKLLPRLHPSPEAVLPPPRAVRSPLVAGLRSPSF